MAWIGDVNRLVDDCARYWAEAGVPRRRVAEMRLELTQHLEAAAAEGRSPESVVGPDVGKFAQEWAEAFAPTGTKTPTWEEVMSGTTSAARRIRRELAALALGVVAVVVAVATAGRGGDPMENEVWRWLWTGLAVVMGIGEIFTAGFFLLPFAIGAAAAAVLAWVGTAVLAQWLVFFAVSIVALVYMRRFVDRQDQATPHRVGANRWYGATGVVLEEIDPDSARGLVRVDNEEWRATSLHGNTIPVGARIVVRDVRGARLIVEEIEY